MNSKSEKLFLLIRKFLEIHLVVRRGSSNHTVRSYRTALAQYVDYVTDTRGIRAEALSFEEFTEELVGDFLTSLEERGCSVSTRNQRLAAIRSFLSFAAQEDISCMAALAQAQRVPKKKAANRVVDYLTEENLALLLAQPDPSTDRGLRDLVILSMLYDTAARAGELIGIGMSDLHLNVPCPYVVLHGKGNKVRSVPLMERTVAMLAEYFGRYHPEPLPSDPLFYTVIKGSKGRMSYENVAKTVAKYGKAAASASRQFPTRTHAHMLRHTRAMHLYQDGVPLSYIREVLGHSSLNTTIIYASSDVEMLRKVMAPLDIDTPTKVPLPEWENNKERLMKLAGLR
ncbi:MAG: site-specific integrase [Eggerthellaceae bacterium]|nr:site-specific integrase [Eggerthellaceae bacterium]